MTCVEKLPCPDCNSKNSLQVFWNEDTEKYTSYCFSKCLALKGDPYNDWDVPPKITKKTTEEIFEEVQDIKKCKLWSKDHRSIPGECFKKWGVRELVSEHDGTTPYAIAFGLTQNKSLVGWQIKTLDKKMFWSKGVAKDVEPFGYTVATGVAAKRLYITEGMLDCIALEYAFKEYHKNTKYSNKEFAVMSLTNGVDSVTSLKKYWPNLKTKFSEFVFVMDNDEAGDRAIKQAQLLFPEMIIADMPADCNDPLEAVEKGLLHELVNNCLWNTHKPPMQGVIKVSDVLARVQEKPVMGLEYPTPLLNEMTFGQRFGECVAIGAGVGLGKTVLAHCWAAHNMTAHGLPCNMVLLEEQNHDTVRNVSGKIDGIAYHKPDTVYDPDQLLATATSLQDKLFMWNSDGDQHLRFDMDEIINCIRFNTMEYGCKFHYLDNMTRLVDHLSPSEANEFINKNSSELENLSVQLDVHIDVFSHLNNTGKLDHERGAEVYASQFTGSRGMMRSFPMMIGFRRNKHAEGIRRNNSIIAILKNRKYGNEGNIRTNYDDITGRINEHNWDGDLTDEGRNTY